jgi:hypothetical protein
VFEAVNLEGARDRRVKSAGRRTGLFTPDDIADFLTALPGGIAEVGERQKNEE